MAVALILIAWFVDMPLWLSITTTILASLKIMYNLITLKDEK